MIKNIFYDLDGTLLPMEMEEFTKVYFGELAKKFAPRGFDPDKLIAAVWQGTKVMVKNDGSITNEEAFWKYFCEEMSVSLDEMSNFEEFYKNEFDKAKTVCGFNEKVPALIESVRELGLRQVLATNPLFPDIATRKRISWAGLKVEDFEAYTTYENSHYCKPNPKYYEELLNRVGMKAEETLMIGNDAVEDVAATKIGMKVFLVTDHLLNPTNVDISDIPHGNFDDALEFIKNQLGVM